MTAQQLRAIGEALYGQQWQRALAWEIAVSDRTMRRWAAGSTPIPAELADQIMSLARERRRSIAAALSPRFGSEGS